MTEARVVTCYQALCDRCGWHGPIIEQKNPCIQWAEIHRQTGCSADAPRQLVPK